jgi:hypothetical protein
MPMPPSASFQRGRVPFSTEFPMSLVCSPCAKPALAQTRDTSVRCCSSPAPRRGARPSRLGARCARRAQSTRAPIAVFTHEPGSGSMLRFEVGLRALGLRAKTRSFIVCLVRSCDHSMHSIGRVECRESLALEWRRLLASRTHVARAGGLCLLAGAPAPVRPHASCRCGSTLDRKATCAAQPS